jgi:Ubiquitin-conjugating enzyme
MATSNHLEANSDGVSESCADCCLLLRFLPAAARIITDVCVSLPRMVMLSGSIQDLLDSPNPDSPAQSEAFNLFTSNKEKYKARIREEARKHAPA